MIKTNKSLSMIQIHKCLSLIEVTHICLSPIEIEKMFITNRSMSLVETNRRLSVIEDFYHIQVFRWYRLLS